MATVRLQPSGFDEPIDITIEVCNPNDSSMLRVSWQDSQCEVELHDTRPGSGFLRLYGLVVQFHAVRIDDTVEVWIHGQRFVIDVANNTTRKRAKHHDRRLRDEIVADMPGTILQINVNPGDSFGAYDPLIVMESMKMEMTLTAPHPGRVKEIGCKVGQLVEVGTVLVRIEPIPDSLGD